MKHSTATTEALFRELAYRESDGIEVSLLWSTTDGSLSVYVTDRRTEDAFELDVAPTEALEAFQHPFAYAGRCDLLAEPCEPAEIAS